MTTEQQLPEGWKIERLGDVIDIQGGSQPPKSEFIYEPMEGYIQLLQIRDFGENGIPTFVPQNRVTKFCDKDDILIARYGASLGRIVTGLAGAYNVALAKTIFDKNLLIKRFVYYLLQTQIFQVPLKMISRSAQNGFAKHEIAHIEIPVPPIETQQAIVNKIESLFDEIDEGIGRLKTAARQIQQYRQSLLKNAFNGELTKEWRSKHADTLPSENELLAQIQTAREQHYAQQLADWQTAVSQWEQNGKEGKKPSKPKAPTQAVKFEENFADLPRGWGVVKLENIAEINSGMSVSANRKLTNPIAVNYLRVGNVQRGYLDLEEIKEMKIEAESFNKYRLRFGDVLFNEGGDRDKLGRGWIWENQVENCITQNHVFRASPFLKSLTHSKYISYLGNSRYGKSYFEETGKQTTNLASINKTVLSNFPVKLPSLAEQTQIVAILESKLTACDQLAAELSKQLKQAELLKQAVLKAAFSGSLLDK